MLVLLGTGSLLCELLLGDPDTVVDELAPAELLGEVVGVERVRVVRAHAAGGEETSVAVELLEKPDREQTQDRDAKRGILRRIQHQDSKPPLLKCSGESAVTSTRALSEITGTLMHMHLTHARSC